MANTCRDDYFGPTVYSNTCERFDFSLLFEDAIFAILPDSLFLLASFARLLGLYRKPPKARWTLQHSINSAIIIAYCLLKLSFLVLEIVDYNNTPRSRLSVAAGSLDFASAVAIALLSYSEQVKSARPAPLITSFLLITLLLDGARARTEWILRASAVVPSIFLASLGLKFVLLVVESLPKTRFLLHHGRRYTFEETAGIFSLSLFSWLYPLIFKGYRHHISIDDLYPVSYDISSESVAARLQGAWKSRLPGKKNKSYSLFIATARALWLPLSLPMIPQLFLVTLNLVQPLLVHTAIEFAENKIEPAVFGYSLIGAFGLTYLGIAIATAWYQYLTARSLAMIRGALISLTYRCMLEMNDGEDDASSSLSLVSVDIDRIVTCLQWVIGVAPDAIQVGIAIWLLEARLGAICVAPVLVVLASALASSQVGKYVRPRQRLWMQAIETRTEAISEVLASMKGVKMLGLTSRVFNHVQGLREKELEISKRYRKVQISNIVMGNSPRLLSPIITFIGFGIIVKVSKNEAPSTATIFSALSLLSILIDPVNELVAIGPNLAAALDCFNRVQEYVMKQKRVDYRNLSFRNEDDYLRPLDEEDNEENITTVASLEPKPAKTAIRLVNVDAGWSKKTLTLRNISLELSPATVNMVIGDIGSGKSTLLKLLLGEVPMLAKGSVSLETDEIAFCGQSPFLRNQSIRDNIIGPLAYDSEWYNTCVNACALDVDFEQMPQKDSTIAGSRGTSLSGGQQQRIALARAAYSRRRIILLDDVLSSLDTITERHCFNNLLGENGLFRYLQSTVVFVTHSVKWLPSANRIIVLGPNGTIQQTGSYEELVSSTGYVQDLVSKLNGDVSEIENSVPRQSLDKNKDTSVEIVRTSSSTRDTKGNYSSVLFYISSMGWMRFLIFVSLVSIEVVTNAMQTPWLSWWTDASQRNPNTSLGKWVGVYAAFGLLSLCFLGLGGAYLLIAIIPKSSNSLHMTTLQSTMSAPIAYLSEKSIATILNLFSQDMTLIDMPLPIALILATGSFGNSIAGAILTSVSSGYMAISIPVLFVTLFFLQKLYLRTSHQLRSLDLEAKSPLLEHFLETLQGLTTIRALSWTEHLASDAFQKLDQSQKPFYLLLCIQRWLTLVLNCVVAVLAVVLMTLTATLRGSINSGLLGVSMVSVVNFGQTLSSFISYWTTLETSLTAIVRIQNYVAETPGEDSTLQAADLPREWPIEPRIEVQHVSASYQNTGREVLKDINISISPGKHVAICGRSGSGKSTLISVLLRLLEPSKGAVFIGGKDISLHTRQAICERLTSMPQDAWFAPRSCGDSVRENLDPLREISDDADIYSVLDKTGLREQIDKIGGLDAKLKQGDGVLSEGQKQLFCLARAMLTRRGGIFIMDEAMSSVDYKTELKMLSLLQTEFQGWTIIAIVHRLRFISQFFDQVVVMEEGRVVEFDEPGRLLSDPSSLFRQMAQAENGGKEHP